MARRFTVRILLAMLAFSCAPALRAQTVVDRIVARVEDDIILLSEVRELGLYQQLVNGKVADREALLGQLIEQWIVKTEATAAAFPRSSDADLDRAAADLEKHFASPAAYQARLRELGLSASAVRRLLAQQLWMARYLDYKFRPAAQIESEQIEKYYRDEFVPALKARSQVAPALDAVREQIRELLVQLDISQRASHWLEEARSRLKIEILHSGEKETGKPAGN
jgi:parvulin-like peptidyl-prolyl isomerase